MTTIFSQLTSLTNGGFLMRRLVTFSILLCSIFLTSACDWDKSSNSNNNNSTCEQTCTVSGWMCVLDECVRPCGTQGECPTGYGCFGLNGFGQFCRYTGQGGDTDTVDQAGQCLEFEQYCNGLDDDCDGEIDENFNLMTRIDHCGACNHACDVLAHSETTCEEGQCRYTCDENWYDFVPDEPGCETACVVNDRNLDSEGHEISCNGDDDDCDGEIDEDCACTNGTARYCGTVNQDAQGECQRGSQECVNGAWTQCNEITSVTEVCDGKDNDCDGNVDEDFEVTYPCQGTFGVCNKSVGRWECTANGGRVCNVDPEGTEFVGSIEVCDHEDNDCDGQTDEDLVLDGGNVGDVCYGLGTCGVGQYECDPAGSGRVFCSTMPFASDDQSQIEVCDGRDNDCDGDTDEDFNVGVACEGVGECGIGVMECDGAEFTRCSTNLEGSSYEGTDEICDGKDNDCDSQTDEDFDIGKDCEARGVCAAGTYVCLTESASICSTYPGAPEVVVADEICDGLDNDCDSEIDENFRIGDACDGVGQCGIGILECASLEETRCSTDLGAVGYDGLPETCDGLDNDCNGHVDETFNIGNHCDGVGECSDGVWECNSSGGARCSTNPGGSNYNASSELCDGLDNDCDGSIDEIFNIGASCNGEGACGTGEIECKTSILTRCSTDLGASQDQSETELCNGSDDDCDGEIDEDFRVGDSCEGVGECGLGVLECNDEQSARCSTDLGGSVYDGNPEKCDGLDNDCDEAIDENYNVGTSCTGTGECSDGTWECDGINGSRCSTNPNGSAYVAQDEACDGKDNDCDGQIDEDYFVGSSCDGEGVCGMGEIECENLTTTRCSTEPSGSQHQNGMESCNNLDDDCDGEIDEDFLIGDPCNGRGECGDGVYQCADAQTIRCTTDVGGTAYDGTMEICDGFDNDCDGDIDEDYSIGNPCWGVGECSAIEGVIECANETSRQCSVLPGGSDYLPSSNELCGDGLGDGLDNDCDGLVDEGCQCENGTQIPCGSDVGECQYGVVNCANNQWSDCQGAFNGYEQELCNGLDDDCDGEVPDNEIDYDGDGYRVCDGDCRDLAPWANPGAVEKCDYADDDCDGQIDEGFFVGAPCSGIGVCEDGHIECSPSNLTVCNTLPGGSLYNQPEEVDLCDDLDNDCDGQEDEGCECHPSGVIDPDSCGPIAQDGIGICQAGSRLCVNNHWGDCFDAVTPLDSELCNGEDDDCDGLTDEDYNFETDPAHCGGCGQACNGLNSTASCVISDCAYVCDSGWYNIDPQVEGCEYNCWMTRSGQELCDGLDNDCDGDIDEETDFDNDPLNCGSCNNVCRNLPQVNQTSCNSGECQIDSCVQGYQDQDGNAGNGCELYLEDIHELACCYTGLNPTDLGQLSWGLSAGGWTSSWNNPLDGNGCFTAIINAQGIENRTVYVDVTQADAPGPPDPQWYGCTETPACTLDGSAVNLGTCVVDQGHPVSIN
jgi:hypothetical protein